MNLENKRQLATILLAAGLGIIAAVLVGKYVDDNVRKQTEEYAKKYQGRNANIMKELDRAKGDIERLKNEQSSLRKQIAQRPKVIQQIAPIKEDRDVPKTAFSLRTPPGKRALTLRINSLSAVGGLVNPGDFVDIIAQLNLPKDKSDGTEKVTTVLFQNIQVLAVGTNYNPAADVPPYEVQQSAPTLNVTFAVNPDEAGLLTFAQSNGDIRLALRSPAETQDRILQEVASWSALADFVLEHQGTELRIPDMSPKVDSTLKDIIVEEEDKKPFIQIFRGGREL